MSDVTVAQLIAELSQLPPNLPVIIHSLCCDIGSYRPVVAVEENEATGAYVTFGYEGR